MERVGAVVVTGVKVGIVLMMRLCTFKKQVRVVVKLG
jgi:hypothetical protein